LHVDWIDNSTILTAYVLQPCGRGDPVRFGYTVLDLHGTTLASADSTSEDGIARYLEPGPNGRVLMVVRERSVQVLDPHFAPLKTIDCEMAHCQTFLSADRTGFAICGDPVKDDCRYFRGATFEKAAFEDFPGGFPILDEITKARSPTATKSESRRYAVTKEESWFFDESGHAFRVKAGGKPEELPSPASTLLKDQCGATLSEEGQNRLLADCVDGIVFGDELVLYEAKHLALYDVPSGRVLFRLNPSVASRTTLSPDGKRLAVERIGPMGGTSVTIYTVP
jgi:hypothetical protein